MVGEKINWGNSLQISILAKFWNTREERPPEARSDAPGIYSMVLKHFKTARGFLGYATAKRGKIGERCRSAQ